MRCCDQCGRPFPDHLVSELWIMNGAPTKKIRLCVLCEVGRIPQLTEGVLPHTPMWDFVQEARNHLASQYAEQHFGRARA